MKQRMSRKVISLAAVKAKRNPAPTPRHFEFVWFRDHWAPMTVALIEAWGSALHEIQDGLAGEAPLRSQRSVLALRDLCNATHLGVIRWSEEYRRKRGGRESLDSNDEWTWFVYDVANVSALRGVRALEELAQICQRRHQDAELAGALLQALALLSPELAIPARLHHRALFEDRAANVTELREFVRDRSRSEEARLHGLACLLDLGGPEGAAAADELRESGRRYGPPSLGMSVQTLVRQFAERSQEAGDEDS